MYGCQVIPDGFDWFAKESKEEEDWHASCFLSSAMMASFSRQCLQLLCILLYDVKCDGLGAILRWIHKCLSLKCIPIHWNNGNPTGIKRFQKGPLLGSSVWQTKSLQNNQALCHKALGSGPNTSLRAGGGWHLLLTCASPICIRTIAGGVVRLVLTQMISLFVFASKQKTISKSLV